MCLSNYSPTQKPKDHITVDCAQSKSFLQTGGNAFKTQAEQSVMNVRDLEELCKKIHTGSTQQSFFQEEQEINMTTIKKEKQKIYRF